jgi:hypothetical protein
VDPQLKGIDHLKTPKIESLVFFVSAALQSDNFSLNIRKQKRAVVRLN